MASKRIKFSGELRKWLQDANLQDPNLSAETINSLIENGYTDTDLFMYCNDNDIEGIVNDYKISTLDKLKLKLAIDRRKNKNNQQISFTELDRTHISTTGNSNKTINSSTKYSQISSNNRNNSVKIPVINLIDSDNDDNNTQSSAATSSSDMANINTNHVNHNTQKIKHTNAYALSGRNLDNQSLPKTNSDTHITSTSTVKLNEQKNIELKDIIIIDSDNNDEIKMKQNYAPTNSKWNNNNNNIPVSGKKRTLDQQKNNINEPQQKKRKYNQNNNVNGNSNIATNMNQRLYNIISEKVTIMGQNVEVLYHVSVHCYICKEYFVEYSKYDKHLQKHYNDGSNKTWLKCDFSCCKNRKPFYSSSSFIGHISTHTNDKPFKCDFPNCGASNGSQWNLGNHWRNMHMHFSKGKNESNNFKRNNQKLKLKLKIKKPTHLNTTEKRFKLQEIPNNKIPTLNRLNLNPHLSDNGTGNGKLERHLNGFRYIDHRNNQLDILFDNIKNGSYQANSSKLMMNFNLKYVIKINNKYFSCVQVFRDVIDDKSTQEFKQFFQSCSAKDNGFTLYEIINGDRPYKCIQCDNTYRNRCNLLGHIETHSKK